MSAMETTLTNEINRVRGIIAAPENVRGLPHSSLEPRRPAIDAMEAAVDAAYVILAADDESAMATAIADLQALS